MRCFIAIDFPEEIKEELGIMQGKIGDPDTKLNLVSTETAHLTLKFLGELNDNQVEEAKKLFSEIKFKKFNAKLGSLGVFPNETFIRVVWVGVESQGETLRLHNLIDDKFLRMNFTKDKAFESHTTLARARLVKDAMNYFEKLEKITVKPLEFTVNKIKLKKSVLTSAGSTYEDLLVLDLE